MSRIRIREVASKPPKECELFSANAGKTIDVSQSTRVYSEPLGRSYTRIMEAKAIGLYSKKYIHCIGKIQKVVEGYDGNSEEDKKRIDSYLSACERNNIDIDEHLKSTKKSTKERPNGLQYYLVDKFYPTSFKKSRPGGQQGRRYIPLGKHMDNPCDKSVEEIAKILNGDDWE